MVDKKQIDPSKKYQSVIRDEKRRILEARTQKWCSRCEKFHPLDEFYPPSVSGISPRSAWCMESTREYMRDRYHRRHPNGRRLTKLERRLRVVKARQSEK
jgi:hypothetical protein